MRTIIKNNIPRYHSVSRVMFNKTSITFLTNPYYHPYMKNRLLHINLTPAVCAPQVPFILPVSLKITQPFLKNITKRNYWQEEYWQKIR